MAAMPFPSNGILLIQGNFPRVFPVFTYNYASCLIPYINSSLILYGEWPSFGFEQFWNVPFLCHMISYYGVDIIKSLYKHKCNNKGLIICVLRFLPTIPPPGGGMPPMTWHDKQH